MDPEEKEKLRLRRQKQERHEVERGERDAFERMRALEGGSRRLDGSSGRNRHDRRVPERDVRTVPVLDEEELHLDDVVATVTAVHRTEIEVEGPFGTRLLIWKALGAPATPQVLAVGDRVVLEPELTDDEDDFEDDEEEPQWTLAGRLPRRTSLQRADSQDRERTRFVAANVDTLLIAAHADRLGEITDSVRRAIAWFEAAGLSLAWVVESDAGGKAKARRLGELGPETMAIHSIEDGPGLRAALAERTFFVVGADEASRHALLAALELPIPESPVRVRADAAKVMPDRATVSHVAFDNGALWLDSPWLRTLQSAEIDAADLPHVFPELARADECEAEECVHRHENGCAVRAAMEESGNARRHPAFVRLRDEFGAP